MTGARVHVQADEAVAGWRPLVHWVLVLPHLVYLAVLTVLSVIAAIITACVVIITGNVPARVAEFQVFALRERARTYGYFFALRSSYPPFAKAVTALDPGDDPFTEVTATGPIAVPRYAPIARLFVVLPHVLVLAPVGLVLDVLYPVWMVAVAINGGWPPAMALTLARVEEWTVEVLLYVCMATDHAPRFGFGRSGAERNVTEGSVVAGTSVVVGARSAAPTGVPTAAPTATHTATAGH